MYTNGTEWLNNLPNLPSKTRDQMILDAVVSGLAYCGWSEVKSTVADHTATFFVCDDAFRVKLDDGSEFRPPVSATLAQQCADAAGLSFLTPKVMDLSYKQATVKLDCIPLSTANMTTTEKSKEYNKLLNKKIDGRSGLIRDCGKAWVISNRMSKGANIAINHGFYSSGSPSVSGGVKLWQNRGAAHDRAHTDYSQTLFLMSQYCLLDGQSTPIIDLMKSPTLHTLISDEGKLAFFKQKI